MFKRILIATDGTPVIERQILYAEHLARVEEAELLVLHAYDPPAQYAAYPGYDRLLERYHEVALALVEEALGVLREDGFVAQGEARAGGPAEMIVAAAAEFDIDLIIMGTRAGGIPPAGGVSAHVVRHAHCPVLQIP
jgi:nucleotide-binding universal stress UspA family protein